MALKTTRFDIHDYLKTPKQRAAYLEAAFEDGDPAAITLALRDVASAIGMSDVAKKAGVSRMGLYKALGEKGDPRLSTLLGIAKSFGLSLSIKA